MPNSAVRAPIRIHADFNGLVRGVVDPSRTAVVVDTFGSLVALSNAGIVLSAGLPLVAFDPSDDAEDLEGHGTAQYDTKRGRWVVEFDEHGVRYVPASGQPLGNDMVLRCLRCGTAIPEVKAATALSSNLRCSACGTGALAALAPPAPRT